ncbi:hypothetical protein [Pleomorphomonas sp. NRK KF1]|uniref:hypothetical protein n=1 Tax=Pleomorphomonas sp. NRK KF1 TaxID=2943000 RepID=UPI002043E03D|nr:hypothetical protein [Pleomorphomonas sp. NRK KF1]MCM5552567.1 hypothetical protein [Pleomorphomonas sp. NRK KF1]
MNVTEVSFVAAAAAVANGKALPAIGQTPARYAGHTFETGADAPDRPGVFVLTTELSGRAHPIYVGESESVIVAVSAVLAANPILKRLTAGVFWQACPFALDRRHLVEELIEEYQPHFNAAAEAEKSDRSSERDDWVRDPIELIARF